jgi:hypothetical protein
MVAITAQSVASPAGGIVNPHLTSALRGFSAIAGWPPYTSPVTAMRQIVLTRNFPVKANNRAISAQKARAYSDDFYNRIHIRPATLALGNVVSAQIATVRVFNAYFVAKTLNAIDGQGAGLTVIGSGAVPMLLFPNQETAWQVSVTPDGPAVLDQILSWRFTGDVATLHVTGNRITAWTLSPDWADGVVERLTWLTDILSSPNGTEQRRADRLAPRRMMEAKIIAEGRERKLMDLMLFGWSARIWALPIWHDQQSLRVDIPLGTQVINCDTTDRDFKVGGLALLRGDTAFDYETIEIAAISPAQLQLVRGTQQAWAMGARITPMRSAQLLTQPEPKRVTDQLSTVEVQFTVVEACDWPAVMPGSLYRGAPVLETRPEESEDLTNAYQRLLLTLDNDTGIPVLTDTADQAFTVQSHRWLLQGRREHAAFRSLLYALRGRQKELWLPTFADDFTLTSIVSANDTTMDIEYVGYTRFAAGKPGRRDIRIGLLDGTVLYRRITGATEISTHTERLAIDAVLGRTVSVSDVQRICYMTLCRQDQDEIELHHDTDSDGVANAQTIFRSTRYDA